MIDGARKKLEKEKTEDDQNINKRKEIGEKTGKMIDYLSRSHKESISRTVYFNNEQSHVLVANSILFQCNLKCRRVVEIFFL